GLCPKMKNHPLGGWMFIAAAPNRGLNLSKFLPLVCKSKMCFWYFRSFEETILDRKSVLEDNFT
ncbi:hypothetical protein, partial [[Ruminococcus] torques]|uniref:hypothetical protein n=1 Tax=[Ruminococcus] torques TaxID=33039 RepID=UPI00241ED6D2